MSAGPDDRLPEGWVRCRLGDLVQPTRPRHQPREFPDLPFIGMEHIQADSMRLLGTANSGQMKSSAVHFWPGDVLYGRLRPYLNKVYRPAFEGLCSAEFIVLPAAAGLESRFVQYRLTSADFVSFASHLNAGDRPRVDFEQIAEFTVSVPPGSEQERIADVLEEQLTRLAATGDLLVRARAKIHSYRASVLKAACEGRLVPTEAELARAEGREYEPADQLLARILKERRARWEADHFAKLTVKSTSPKDDAWKKKYVKPAPPDMLGLPKLPDGWAWATVEQLSEPERPVTYGVVKLGAPVEHGVPTLRSSNVRRLRLDLRGLKRISAEIARQYKRTFLKGGEVLVTVRGTLGGVVVAPVTCAGFNVSREVAVISPNHPATGFWIAHYIASESGVNWIARNLKGIAYTGLNIETLNRMPVALPPLGEQQRIIAEAERRLSIADETEATIESALARAERLRQAILKRAFEGRLVPQDPSDEPASVLLERIRRQREGAVQAPLRQRSTTGVRRPRKARRV